MVVLVVINPFTFSVTNLSALCPIGEVMASPSVVRVTVR
jgi:hypothetical protein